MNKKGLVIIALLVCIIAFTLLFSGCTENFKQNAIPGNYSNKEITSNGGLVVTYGEYLYFINGHAAKEADNKFGDVVKGAIMRVKLDDKKEPILDTLTMIVPKKVYSTDSTYGGIYIYNDYIYYSTTGTKRDSQGNFKTDEKVIMRTKVDGTNTEKIIEFDNHDIPYKIINNSLVYIKDRTIYRINLLDKKFSSKVLDKNIGSSHFFTRTQDAGGKMDNFVVYTKTDEETSKQTIKILAIDGNLKKEIFSSDMMGEDAIYTATIIDLITYEDKLTIFYSIEDDKPNQHSAGVYSYSYDKDFKFEKKHLIRYTKNVSSTEGLDYSKFYYLNGYVLALGKAKGSSDSSVSKFDLYSNEGEYIQNINIFNETIEVYDIFTKDNSVYIYYTAASKLYKIKLLEYNEDNQLIIVESDAVLYYDGAFGSQGVAAEIVDDILYFTNNKISDNIFFLNLSKVKERDSKSRQPSVLGKITDEDRIEAF